MLGWNCSTYSDCGKTLKFAEVDQIREFCKSRSVHKKFSLSYVQMWAAVARQGESQTTEKLGPWGCSAIGFTNDSLHIWYFSA